MSAENTAASSTDGVTAKQDGVGMATPTESLRSEPTKTGSSDDRKVSEAAEKTRSDVRQVRWLRCRNSSDEFCHRSVKTFSKKLVNYVYA